MRADLRIAGEEAGMVASRRRRPTPARSERAEAAPCLEPCAVDAVLADESMLLFEELPTSRCDAAHPSVTGAPVNWSGSGAPFQESVGQGVSGDEQLLRSLSAQLDLINQQQREIRSLLDQAGRRRLDRLAT